MMKKIFCVLFILCVAVCCGYSWGLLPSMVEGNILIFKLVKQSSPVLTTCVREKQEVRDKKNGGWTYEYQNIKDRDIRYQFLKETEEGFNLWFSRVREVIAKANRTEEFQDILSVLPTKIVLKEVQDCSQAVLKLTYYPSSGFVKGTAQHKTFSHEIELRAAYSNNGIYTSMTPRQVIYHEVGHLLGLSDQYVLRLPEKRFIFSSFYENGQAVMGNQNTQIAVDDVEGLIHAVDFVLGYKYGQMSPRVKNGWKSFSDPTVHYAYMRPYIPEQKDERAAFAQEWELLSSVKNNFDLLGRFSDNLEREIANYFSQIKQKYEVNSKRVTELTEEEIRYLMLLAKINYLQNIQREVDYVQNEIFEKLTNVHSWRILSQKVEKLSSKYDIPNIRFNQTELDKTQTLESVSKVLECATCGKTIDNVNDSMMLYFNKSHTLAFYIHKDCFPATKHNPPAKYVHKVSEMRDNGYVFLTYKELVKELERKQLGPSLQQQLDSKLNFNFQATKTTARSKPVANKSVRKR